MEGQEQPASPAPKTSAAQPTAVDAALAADLAAEVVRDVPQAGGFRLSALHILVLLNTVVVSLIALALFGLLPVGGGDEPPPARSAASVVVQLTPASEPATGPSAAELAAPAGASWNLAQTELQAQNYPAALRCLDELTASTASDPAQAALAGLIHLRSGECLVRMGRTRDGAARLMMAARSPSPAVRGQAWARLAALDATDGQYLMARMKAYSAIAALGALGRPTGLERDCDYLVAAVLSKHVLTLHNGDLSVPWGWARQGDLFATLNEQAISALLKVGADDAESVLAPQIARVAGEGARVSARCGNAPLEELLTRLNAATGADIQLEGLSTAARRRAVALAAQAVTDQRLAEVACGSVGLVARFTGESIIIIDPAETSAVAQRREVLTDEAASAWRRFFLAWPEDERSPMGRLVLAGICDAAGDVPAAIREYRLVAGRYATIEPVAAEALLRCANLKLGLRDFAGARQDLIDLLDSYPRFERADRVYLSLAAASYSGGYYQEALNSYIKLYYLNLSPQSQADACLGAGRCYTRLSQPADAAQWLGRYIKLAKSPPADELAGAYLLLGQAQRSLDDARGAIISLDAAMAAKPSMPVYVEAGLELARLHVAAGRYSLAVGLLNRLYNLDITHQQATECLLMTSQCYRSMGLGEKSAMMLRRQMEQVKPAELRGAIGVELARCLVQTEDLAAAEAALTEAIGRLPAGESAWSAMCDLGEVCMQSGKHAQAAAVAEDVLKAKCSDPLRQRASGLLSAALAAQQQYDKAAAVAARGGATR